MGSKAKAARGKGRAVLRPLCMSERMGSFREMSGSQSGGGGFPHKLRRVVTELRRAVCAVDKAGDLGHK